jgi:hypothetical protein
VQLIELLVNRRHGSNYAIPTSIVRETSPSASAIPLEHSFRRIV